MAIMALREVKEIVKNIVQERFSEDGEVKIQIIDMERESHNKYWKIYLEVFMGEKYKNITLGIDDEGNLQSFKENNWRG